MINFIKEWANQIIVAIIIATIFEMILSSSNNKKYIKMIIGIYVLFTIIQPIVKQVRGNDFNISEFNYKKYFTEETLQTSSEDFENTNSKLIEQAYINNISNDLKMKLNQKGYEVISCNIDIIGNKQNENYGTIKAISLQIEKLEEAEEIKNTITVENINISSNNSSNISNNTKSNISEKEITEIIKYLTSEYSINMENIKIN